MKVWSSLARGNQPKREEPMRWLFPFTQLWTLKVFKRLDKLFKRGDLIDVMNIDISNDPFFINDEQGPFGDPV